MLRVLLLASLFLVGCTAGGNSSSSPSISGPTAVTEQEPNDASVTANALAYGKAGTGTISSPSDLDFWSFQANAGDVVTVELAATRLDQLTWDMLCNAPRLTLYAPDGTTVMQDQNYADGWMLGKHDLDFPLVYIPASGTYYLSVASDVLNVAGGSYALTVRKRDVGTIQLEQEPAGTTGGNDQPIDAEAITPETIVGQHVDGSSDFYKFSISSASVVCFELVANRDGVSDSQTEYYKPQLNLYDRDGTTLLDSADGVFFNDPRLCARLSVAGTYFLEVGQASSGGDGNYLLSYVLTPVDNVLSEVESNDTPATANGIARGTGIFQASISTQDVDYYSFGGDAGEEVLVELIPDVAGTSLEARFFAPDGVTMLPSDSDSIGGIVTARTILTQTGVFYLRVTGVAAAPVVYNVSLTRPLAAGFESEPNDSAGQSNSLNANGLAAGIISSGTDVDYYRFDAQANELVIVSILAKRVDRNTVGSDGFRAFSGYGSNLKPKLEIVGSSGMTRALSTYVPPDDCDTAEDVVDGQPTLAAAFIAPAKGTYYIKVSSADGTGGADHYYIVRRR